MKRFFHVFLAVLLIITQFYAPVSAEIDEDTSKLMPKLSIISDKIPTGDAGSNIDIPITIKNTGYTAKDVVITPEIDSASPFTINDLTFSQSLDKIEGDRTVDVTLKLKIDSLAAEKNYPIKLNFQFTNSYGDPGTYNTVVYVKVINRISPPRLIISKVDIGSESIAPGETVEVGFDIANNGTEEAKDIKFSLEGLSDEGFVMGEGSNTQYIQKIAGGFHGYVKFNLKASSKASRGSHGLDLKFSYKDRQNQAYEDTQKVFINIGGKGGSNSNLSMENIVYPDEGITPEKNFTIGFDLVNHGKLDASNIVVKVESSDPAIVPKTASIKKIIGIAPEGTEHVDFVLSPTKEATAKNYPINITVEYEDELNFGKDDEKYMLTQYVGVYVDKEDSGKEKPKLIIDKYSFSPALVNAGENFVMNLSFFNTNKDKAVRNIKISLSVNDQTKENGSNVFSPVGSSNTFYIDSIAPKGRVEKQITMYTVPTAEAKTYTVTATFEYEDNDGQELTATELVGVPVVQKSKLQTGELTISTEAFVGTPIPISIDFYNTGKVTLYNTMVKLEGDFQTENGNYYLGNFESGGSDSYEGTIIPQATGEVKGALVFSYEDSRGETVEVRKEFALNVQEAPPAPNPDELPPQEKQSKNIFKTAKFWAIVIPIILAIIVIKIWRKKKKEKAMSIDE
ncbi:COG1361 S-layer family protein [Sporanaerobacter sp. PP17-6a]|uniref:COG1361 S-layer family protein n=1 Tax=Sporanaerobacter sp. PP17-6a TaxID=1891289 RepID=UPI0008A0969F|nr:hypothetical protein [Sporanaerobacter sp. PP17-6a]SCL87292.1 hypothetical protein PP176A_1277 [Sporanaerobacter sp. PP17-6a]